MDRLQHPDGNTRSVGKVMRAGHRVDDSPLRVFPKEATDYIVDNTERRTKHLKRKASTRSEYRKTKHISRMRHQLRAEYKK